MFVKVKVLPSPSTRRSEPTFDADFATAIRIIDHLASRGAVPSPGPDQFVPGTTRGEMLLAELAVEERLSAAIAAAADCRDAAARELVTEAAAPRTAYTSWLRDQTRETACQPRQAGDRAIDGLFSAMMTWIEQTTIHAFLHWHRSDRILADATWASSGAAMMRATALTRALAALGTTPAPGPVEAPRISADPIEAQALDRSIAKTSAGLARAAADSTGDAPVPAECRRASDLASAIAAWRSEAPHPALTSNPPALTRLQDPPREHVWSRQGGDGAAP